MTFRDLNKNGSLHIYEDPRRSTEEGINGTFGEDANLFSKLPFEMPSSMKAVRNQKEDVPYDSGNPLFPFGFGLSY